MARKEYSYNRLQRLEEKLDDIDEKLSTMDKNVEHRVTALEVKSGVWGVLGGFLSAIGIWFADKVR